MNVDFLKNKLLSMPNVSSLDVTGDGMHFQIRLVSKEFEGKNKISRQRMVYQYLKEWLEDGSLHAVELNTLTPLEWEKTNHE